MENTINTTPKKSSHSMHIIGWVLLGLTMLGLGLITVSKNSSTLAEGYLGIITAIVKITGAGSFLAGILAFIMQGQTTRRKISAIALLLPFVGAVIIAFILIIHAVFFTNTFW